jgi:hypothetical protein
VCLFHSVTFVSKANLLPSAAQTARALSSRQRECPRRGSQPLCVREMVPKTISSKEETRDNRCRLTRVPYSPQGHTVVCACGEYAPRTNGCTCIVAVLCLCIGRHPRTDCPFVLAWGNCEFVLFKDTHTFHSTWGHKSREAHVPVPLKGNNALSPLCTYERSWL